MTEYGKVIELERRPDTGELVNHREVRIEYEPFRDLRETQVEGKTYRRTLLEALLNQPDAANMLRQDLKFIAFSTYAATATTWEQFTSRQASNREQEEYLRDGTIGVIPQAPSGTPVPRATKSFEGGTIIKNHLYRLMFEVLGDWIRYDKINLIRGLAAEMGRAAAMTVEAEMYAFITTTGNYTRNSTTNDNDVGANQVDTDFNALGIDAALTTISTAKDRKSGHYLGYMADTFITGPKMEYAAKQFFLSNDLQRATNNGVTEVRGQGTYNPYQGMVSKIIVSPWFGNSYGWAMCDSRAMGLVYQDVEAFNVYQETQGITSESWLTMDTIRYLVRGTFGRGFVDDRAWFYSPNTTAPNVS